MTVRLKLAASALLAATSVLPVAAQPVLDPMFRDSAVLQRDHPIHIRGQADPDEALDATLGSVKASATADSTGRFQIVFPPMRASGPIQLEVTGASGTVSASDLLIGDVFLCSGQSNMELSVGRAQDADNQIAASADPLLRLFTIHRQTALEPAQALGKVSGWATAAPASVERFSAACYYMAQNLRRSAKVPVGAIHSSWGGSRISAWMSDDGLNASGLGEAAALRTLYARDPVAASLQAGRTWEAWWRSASGDAQGAEPWQADAPLAWKPVPRISFWEEWGDPDLAAFNGMVWFRRSVMLTPAQARQAATLAIGPVDDADQTWLNGKPVGNGGNPGKPRVYTIAQGGLQAGRNIITVNAHDSYGRGGMPGPADVMQITLADGTIIPLGDNWEYAVEARKLARPPRAPWEDTAGAGTMFNAMIAPLGRIGLKGVAWYQGESDVDLPGYALRMKALMTGWRQQFDVADLPFAIVQLANFGAPSAAPTESGWASLREQQRRAVLADNGHSALALAIDLGDPVDIHPGEKREIGKRLARAMRAVAYGGTEPPSGPMIETARRTANGGAVLTFADVTAALVTRSSQTAIGFELCGPEAGSCRYATGTVAGTTVTLPGDGRIATRVRYAWADSPVVNLYDGAWLPAGPFEIDLR